MRATWKGAISFGLVNIPVELYPATVSESRSAAHQVHEKDGGRIRYRRICELDGEEVPYAEIAKAYESSDGRQVVLTDEDMAELPLPSKKVVDVLAFVDEADIDPLVLSKPYYLGPAGPTGTKPYVLIREALAGQGRAAVTKITLSTRESLALVRAQGDVLTLQTMLWPDELRAPRGIAPTENVTIRPQELKMAASLMDTLSEDFDLADVHDDYQRALDALVEAKASGAHPDEAAGGTATAGNVVDLMSALTASVEAATKGRPAPTKRTTPKATTGGDSKKKSTAARPRRKTG
ncbi:Ku protein [Embleya scabrispora]|uniref:Non-homologous end joining protein Ku n=1 Tax=Embleya scabrispora TaxID=159449 RepID=A0A1T3NIV6_9ACTN|nr:Ku protein [Embleya scabrispora]OPC76743.1 Ku protein [Embleya scabrispora]